MFSGDAVVELVERLGFTHLVWLPDSALGPWESALATAPRLRLLRVCREGEAWALAAGLTLGGARPLVMIQNTGLFESGDALRNVLFDLELPLSAWIGYRSYLVKGSTDSAKRFTEPILAAWGLEWLLVERAEQAAEIAPYLLERRREGRPGIVLMAEGSP